ncbi:MAG: carboxypeptidase regulatory-like domain-containing protein [Gammaproteobacteria bacterium]|nr:carboxypeptidase regulatory-like domain-containing protein [Gammaproteobacteria bacterium]
MQPNRSRLAIVAGLLGGLGVWHSADASSTTPVIGHSLKQSSSHIALREGKPLSRAEAQRRFDKLLSSPLKSASARRLDQGFEVLPRFDLPRPAAKKPLSPLKADPAVQAAPVAANMPDPLTSFDGIGNVTGVLPPDTNGEVGPNHFVQTVNSSVAIWDKQGNQLLSPVAINSLWAGFGGICESNNDGDPIVMYDQLADRWFISQFALGFPNNFHQCIAVSKGGDPTGEYYLYDFKISDSKMNDYPHFGVWPDGYYMSINQFNGASFAWAGAGAVVFEREKMLAGQPANMVYFDLHGVDPGLGGMLPADLDGIMGPAAGAPMPFLQADDDNYGAPQDQLQIWEFQVDWASPANSSFTHKTNLATAPFKSGVCEFARNCVPQPGGTPLDAISDRLMFRMAYRNFGDHDALVLNQTVDADSGGNHAGVRWYEVRNFHTAPEIHQQGTYAPDADHRWMASAAMDAVGNIAIGFAKSGSSTFPSVGYTARLANDPLGEMSQGEGLLVAGGGSQSHSSGRFGDYSDLTIDPSDDCTFWYTQEYYASSSSANWSTRIGSFKMPNCVAGPSGKLEGSVTSGADAAPVVNARVEAGSSATTTDSTGHFSLVLPVGEFDVKVRAYGYQQVLANDVAIEDETTTAKDFALTALTPVTLTGKVKDGAGHGWPLYAKLSVAAELAPEIKAFTNPVTGEYTLQLFQDWPYEFTVQPALAGYAGMSRTVEFASATPGSEDFALSGDDSCSAPGQGMNGLAENFENGIPAGWTVTDEAGNGVVWKTNEDYGRPNRTGGSGLSATADSDASGTKAYDTSLITGDIAVAGLPSTTLLYKADFRQYSGLDYLALDISVDGGAWTNVSDWHSNHLGESVSVDLGAFMSGATSFRLRWHYGTNEVGAPWDWWAQIDDVEIQGSGCVAQPGGLVVGTVRDANTELALNEAVVSDVLSTSSMATPEDENRDDGLFILFAPVGERTLNLSASGYEAGAATVSVIADTAVETSVALKAGRLALSGESIDITVAQGKQGHPAFALSNTGTATADFTLFELNAPVQAVTPDAHRDPSNRLAAPKKLSDVVSGLRIYNPPAVPVLAGGEVLSSWPTNLAYAWGLGVNRESGDLWLGNIGAGGGDDLDYRFLPDGTNTGETIDTSSWVSTFAADMAYDDRNGTLWQVNVGGDNCIHELSLADKVPTGNTICPAFGASQRGLAYDPVTDTFFSGSWNDTNIVRFNRSGEILAQRTVGLAVAGLAYNPGTGHLFVMANADKGLDTYVLDVNDDYAVVGGFNVEDMGGSGQSGLEIDCAGHLWMVEQQTKSVLEVESGETGVCAWKDITWLTATPGEGELAVGANQDLSLDVSAVDLPVGNYSAQLVVKNQTPYGNLSVPVNFTVRERLPGHLRFETSEYTGDENAELTLSVTRTDGGDGEISVHYALANDTATAGDDFVAAEGTLTWADEDTAAKTITVQLNRDALLEGSESLLVRLSEATGGAQIDDELTIVKIADKTDGGALSLSVVRLDVQESAGKAVLTVNRSGGSDGAVTVHVATLAGTATSSDFAALSADLSWADGEAGAKTVEVTITNDGDVEAVESFSVVLSNASSPAKLGDQTVANVTITSDDKKGGGGSFGLGLLLAAAGVSLARRKQNAR